MKKILILAIMFISALGIEAQEIKSIKTESENKIMVGLSGSFTYGTGISVKSVMDKHGFTLAVLPFYSTEGGLGLSALNLGVSYNYYFRQNDFVDFSMKVGGQYLGGDADLILLSASDSKINIGIGPEVNFHILPELDVEFNLGYGIYDIVDSLNSSLTAGIGFYYNIYL